MNREEIEAVIRAALEVHVEPPEDAKALLGLKSLELVVVAEDLEQQLGFLIGARELTVENFGTRARLVAFVERKLAEELERKLSGPKEAPKSIEEKIADAAKKGST